jgi:SOS-response transcriptional repressor LexA
MPRGYPERKRGWWGARDRTQNCIEVERFLRGYIKSRGYAPSLQEICDHTGIRSKSTAKDVLDDLERRGRIKRDFNVARSIRMVGK